MLDLFDEERLRITVNRCICQRLVFSVKLYGMSAS